MRTILLVLMLVIAGVGGIACGPHVVRAGDVVPGDVQLNLSRASRVWIAGFRVTENREVNLNVETVNLLRRELRRVTSLEVVEAEPLVVSSDAVFTDHAYWERLASEHGSPLIVTGTISFLVAPATMVQRGRRMYVSAVGRILEPEVVVLDGHTGEVVLKERLPRRMRYGIGRFAFTLPLYFDLMDRSMADWIRAIGAGAAVAIQPPSG